LPQTSPGSESTIAEDDAQTLESKRFVAHPLLVREPVLVEDLAKPERFMLDCHLAMTASLTRSANVFNENPFWFSMATEPLPLHIPPVSNPLFENKGRAAQYQHLRIF